MTRLAPCPACNRHVRLDETQCPFCAATLGDSLKARPTMATAGLKRAALFALGAALTTAACGEDDDSKGVAKQKQGTDHAGGSAGTGGSSEGRDEGAGGKSSEASGGTSGEAKGGASGEATGGLGGEGEEVPTPQPVYGAPIPPDAGAIVDPEPPPGPLPLYGAVPAPE